MEVLETDVQFRGELSVMGKEGDLKYVWDRRNKAEVDEARNTFDRLKREGYYAYKVEGKDAHKGEIIQKFDADLEAIIMAPRPIGG